MELIHYYIEADVKQLRLLIVSLAQVLTKQSYWTSYSLCPKIYYKYNLNYY